MRQTRRRFLTTLSLAGAASFLRGGPSLRAEGLSDIRYVDTGRGAASEAISSGKVDFSLSYASEFAQAIDSGQPITLLAGVMVGCFELFAREGIGSIVD